MIIIKVSGGLGNQMFQYIFLKYLENLSYEVKIDCSSYDFTKQHNGFELDRVFSIKPQLATSEEIRNLGADSFRLYRKVLNKLIGESPCVIHQGPGYKLVSQFTDNKYYDGVWMNLHYFPDEHNQVRQYFRFPYVNNQKNELLESEMREHNSVAVHVRRGDYVNNSVHGGVCDENYYNSAIKIIDRHVANPYYYFFSDDPDWVREKFHFSHMRVVDWNQNDESFWDMYLMSCAKHNIIANSTFSWWGAFLNQNDNKIVIGPKYWFQSEIKENRQECADAIMPSSWLRIGGSK